MRLTIIALVLLLCPACITEADKRQWADVWKDARGDNMEMRNDMLSDSGSSKRSSDNR
jgi:hypothetical protein